MGRRLTQKQETFARNLFEGMTQHDAWIQAGYSSNYSTAIIDKNACVLANSSKIKVRYDELQQATVDASIATVKERKQILTEIYRGRIGDYLGEDQRIKQGEPLTSAAIQEVTTEEVKIGRRENAQLVAITKIKLLNPVQAIAEHNKMEKIYAEGSIVIDNRTLNISVISEKAKELTERLIEGERTE